MRIAHRLSSIAAASSLIAVGLIAAPAQAAAPDTSITSGPRDYVNVASVSFGFTSNDPFASFECQWDTDPWAACTGTSTATLGDGLHRFSVRAITGGEADPTPAMQEFTVDTTAPDTRITANPGAKIPATGTASYQFAANEPATFQCRWDSKAWGSCQAATRLAPGVHRFEVRAVDRAGNVDATPASHTLSVGTGTAGGGGGSARPIQVRAQAVLGTILGIDVDPNNRRRDYRIIVERRTGNHWKVVARDRTRGVQDVRAIDLKKGVYRVRVPRQLGLAGAVSAPVRLSS